jgi:hypothetical protein
MEWARINDSLPVYSEDGLIRVRFKVQNHWFWDDGSILFDNRIWRATNWVPLPAPHTTEVIV